jgi:hypothetical protein
LSARSTPSTVVPGTGGLPRRSASPYSREAIWIGREVLATGSLGVEGAPPVGMAESGFGIIIYAGERLETMVVARWRTRVNAER